MATLNKQRVFEKNNILQPKASAESSIWLHKHTTYKKKASVERVILIE